MKPLKNKIYEIINEVCKFYNKIKDYKNNSLTLSQSKIWHVFNFIFSSVLSKSKELLIENEAYFMILFKKQLNFLNIYKKY